MDFKVSRKEPRQQPPSFFEVLASDIFDLYPVFSPDDPNLLIDAEVLDDDREELLDRAMFAVAKQQGQDPLNPEDGIPYGEALAGEVSVPALIPRIAAAVRSEGPGVRVTFDTLSNGSRDYLAINVSLTDAV
jgi:hypothetical protein